MEDVLQLIVKVLVMILTILKKGIDWALVKLNALNTKLIAKVEAKKTRAPAATKEKAADIAPEAPAESPSSEGNDSGE